MTAATLTLTDFLLARIAEDEAVVTQPFGSWSQRGHAFEWAEVGAISEVLVVGEDRVLAECAAKRAIVNGHGDYHVCPNFSDAGSTDYVGKYDEPGMRPCPTLLALLSIYVDHPDYRSEWAP